MLENVLLSGYTRKTGKGIYKSQLDTETGELTEPEVYIESNGPTYIDVTNDLKLVAIKKTAGGGGIALYDISGDQPKFLDEDVSETNSPSFVKIDQSRNLVFSAYFHLSKVTIHQITDDNKLELLSTINFEGTGPRAEQDQSKPHYSVVTPDGKLIICDYGTDRISIYDIDDPTDPKLLNNYIAPAGYAPRHLVFHPTKPYIYVACELSSKVLVLKYDADDTRLTLVDEATVAKDEQKNTTAAIRITNDGKYLYVSTRGADTIAAFEINETGDRLKTLGSAKTNGNGPRDFELDPSEKFVLAANQDSDNLTLFKRNPNKGLLSVVKDNIGIPECVCVHFI
ncbi:lactonase family protein [Companilactobacillus ginsenosidimutans]|uniref:6-phosphogluconolactonase n=1 Tax=Companilactobacillus ginsenosidimutans TaxID=1007676 RepID=A0A0H4QJU6_9LACO|nr:lactonase family protein [Companilactobacillus ginsenosidimutans]AKP68192.1 hypothetical protein ABM34_12045 [Companilactobacillus ginsenosidimutans]